MYVLMKNIIMVDGYWSSNFTHLPTSFSKKKKKLIYPPRSLLPHNRWIVLVDEGRMMETPVLKTEFPELRGIYDSHSTTPRFIIMSMNPEILDLHQCTCTNYAMTPIRLSLDFTEKEKKIAFDIFSVGSMHCSQDPQVRKNANVKLKLDPTVLFTHLKIILLQYFKFSVISGI